MEGALQRSVLVRNIPYTANEEQLQEIFEAVGPVSSFRLLKNPETGQTKGLGVCEYRDVAAAEEAVIRLNNYEMNGRELQVERAPNNMEKMLAGPSLSQLAGPSNSASAQNNPAAQMEAITQRIETMTAMQMYIVMGQLRQIVDKNRDQAKKLLTENPHLSIAFLRIQERLQMLNGLVLPPPSGDKPIIVAKSEPPADPRTATIKQEPSTLPPAAAAPPSFAQPPAALPPPQAGQAAFWPAPAPGPMQVHPTLQQLPPQHLAPPPGQPFPPPQGFGAPLAAPPGWPGGPFPAGGAGAGIPAHGMAGPPPPEAMTAGHAPAGGAAAAAAAAAENPLTKMLASLAPAQVEQLKALVQLPPEKLDSINISAQQKALVASLRQLWQAGGVPA